MDFWVSPHPDWPRCHCHLFFGEVEYEEGRITLSSCCCCSAQTNCPAHCFLLPLPVASRLEVPWMFFPSVAIVPSYFIFANVARWLELFLLSDPFCFQGLLLNFWSIERTLLLSSDYGLQLKIFLYIHRCMYIHVHTHVYI